MKIFSASHSLDGTDLMTESWESLSKEDEQFQSQDHTQDHESSWRRKPGFIWLSASEGEDGEVDLLEGGGEHHDVDGRPVQRLVNLWRIVDPGQVVFITEILENKVDETWEINDINVDDEDEILLMGEMRGWTRLSSMVSVKMTSMRA